MNSKSAKLLLFSLSIMLFSLMLAFAGFVFVLLDVAPAVIQLSGSVISYAGTGRVVYIIVWLAITAGVGGLFVAWFGLFRND